MRFTVAVLAVLVGLLIAAPAEASRYPAPALTNPTVVQVPTSGLSRSFAPTEDVILDLPDVPVTGAVATVGGDDIRVVGGQIGGGLTFNGTNGIVARELRGSLYVEGVLVDFSQLTNKDNIVATGYSPCGTARSNWTYPKVYIQNSRLLGSKYVSPGEHPDLYQKQGPMGSLYIDHVTGESSYQGFMTNAQSFSSACSGGSQETYTEGIKDGSRFAVGESVISDTNLRHRSDTVSGYLAWFNWDAGSNGSFSGEDPWPHRLENFYVKGRPQGDRSICCNLIYPRTSTGTAENGAVIRMNPVATVNGYPTATWPSTALISGEARQGDPPGGDFSPAGVAGLAYAVEPVPAPTPTPTPTPEPTPTPVPVYAPACAPDCDETIAGLRADVSRLSALLDKARGAWADLSGVLNP
jgi:hypothetical protein